MYKTLLLMVCIVKLCEGTMGDSVLGKIKSSFAYAGKMLGLDRATNVAQLVSEAFGRNEHKKGESNASNNIFSGFLRVLGLDTRRIGAMAVNAIIFMAQLITTSLSKPAPAYVMEGKSIQGSPFEWVMERPEVKATLADANNANLPIEIIKYLQEGNLNNNGCIQLLICKSAPFIWSMQRAIQSKETQSGVGAFTQFMPTVEEVADYGDQCEDNYPHCTLHF